MRNAASAARRTEPVALGHRQDSVALLVHGKVAARPVAEKNRVLRIAVRASTARTDRITLVLGAAALLLALEVAAALLVAENAPNAALETTNTHVALLEPENLLRVEPCGERPDSMPVLAQDCNEAGASVAQLHLALVALGPGCQRNSARGGRGRHRAL